MSLAIAGVIAITLGIGCILILFQATLIDVWYVGVLLLPIVLVLTVSLWAAKGRKGTIEQWLIPVAYGFCAAVILWDPLLSSGYAKFVPAGTLLVAGAVRIWTARHLIAPGSRMAIRATGATAILFAAAALSGGPLSDLFGVALFLSLECILQGISCLVLARTTRTIRLDGTTC